MQAGIIKSRDDTQAISRLLRISFTRARSLQYDTLLRQISASDEEADEWLRTEVFDALQCARFSKEIGKIELAISNPLAREELAAVLSRRGVIVDGAFRSEILRLHYDNYVDLLGLLTNEEQRREIEEAIVDALKRLHPTVPAISIPRGRELFRIFLESVAKTAGSESVELGLDLLTAGVSRLPEIIGGLLGMRAKR